MQKVRLPDGYLEKITKLFGEVFGKDDHLWLFGSRVDLSKRGGDIDLYIETQEPSFDIAWDKKKDFWWGMQKVLGEQKIDVVVNLLDRKLTKRIYAEAKATGVMLV